MNSAPVLSRKPVIVPAHEPPTTPTTPPAPAAPARSATSAPHVPASAPSPAPEPAASPASAVAAPANPLIVAESLSVFYGEFEAVKSVSLSIPAHRAVALIGPSGCGKSTFLRAINRLNDLIPGCRVSGRLTIAGADVYARDTDLVALRRHVGLVFQKPNPFPRSVYENVAFGPMLQGVRRRAKLEPIVEDALRKAALWDEVKDRLRASAIALSGGQQQRLCIARALATGPQVLLMDEPASALDPIATAKIEDLINELKRIVTIVIVTHNMQQAARVSDHTAFFYLGRLIEYDDTRTIFTSPGQKQTEDYVTGRFG